MSDVSAIVGRVKNRPLVRDYESLTRTDCLIELYDSSSSHTKIRHIENARLVSMLVANSSLRVASFAYKCEALAPNTAATPTHAHACARLLWVRVHESCRCG